MEESLAIIVATFESVSETPSRRLAAIRELGHLGLAAAGAVPVLRSHFTILDSLPHATESQVDEKAAILESLTRIGTSEAREFLAKLTHPNVPELATGLVDGNWEVRLDAATKLGEFGPLAYQAIPALTRSLRDSELPVRCAAAIALGAMGKRADQAVESLNDVMWREHGVLGNIAAQALRRIGTKTAMEAADRYYEIQTRQTVDGSIRKLLERFRHFVTKSCK